MFYLVHRHLRRRLCRLLYPALLLYRRMGMRRRLRKIRLLGGLDGPLPLLALVGNLLVGNVVDHNGRRFDIILLILYPICPGTVGNGPDEAGNGNLKRSKQRKNAAANG